MIYPRLMIAGVQSGAGKTTVALGLMAALRDSGWRVQPFKVGPDYIDPGWHRVAAGRPSHNLDSWMGPDGAVQTIFQKNAAGMDVSIIEGVMGLYDGARNSGIKGSSAHVAMILKTPVVLVVNVRGMAQSCLAVVKGFKDYQPEMDLPGVILNQAGLYHKTVLTKALEEELGVRVLGCLPDRTDIKMPERHLGLQPAEENRQLGKVVESMAGLIAQELDLSAILNLARQAAPLPAINNNVSPGPLVKLGVARDEAFSFYYQDNLDYLEELGGQLIYFSPLHDQKLPEVDGLYLGGGFPEMFLPRLAGNESMKTSVASAYNRCMPIYAECGGFMYLARSISDFESRTWSGVGIIPAEFKMEHCLQALGYIEAQSQQDSIMLACGDKVRGHEFHYSRTWGLDPDKAAYALTGGRGENGRLDGYVQKNLLASYIHLHLRSNPHAAGRFLQACREYQRERCEADSKDLR